MSPPNSLHWPDSSVVALSPGLKIFLSGSVLLLGLMGTLPFYHGANSPLPPSTTDERIAAAPLPTDQTVSVRSPIRSEATEYLVQSTSQTLLPVKAEKLEKYAQAYPEPQLASEPRLSKSVGSSSEPIAGTAVKPIVIVVPLREFSSIHRLTTSTTAFPDRKAMVFDKQPESIDPSKTADMLLPMFHFAENLKPLSKENGVRTPPANPFERQLIEVSAAENKKLSPLRPYIELRPLRIPGKE